MVKNHLDAILLIASRVFKAMDKSKSIGGDMKAIDLTFVVIAVKSLLDQAHLTLI